MHVAVHLWGVRLGGVLCVLLITKAILQIRTGMEALESVVLQFLKLFFL